MPKSFFNKFKAKTSPHLSTGDFKKSLHLQEPLIPKPKSSKHTNKGIAGGSLGSIIPPTSVLGLAKIPEEVSSASEVEDKTKKIVEFFTKPDAAKGAQIVRLGEFIQFIGVLNPETAPVLAPLGVALIAAGELKAGKSGAKLGASIGADIGSALGGPFAQEMGKVIGGFVGEGVIPEKTELKEAEKGFITGGDVGDIDVAGSRANKERDDRNTGASHGQVPHGLELGLQHNKHIQDKDNHHGKAQLPSDLQATGRDTAIGSTLTGGLQDLSTSNRQQLQQGLAQAQSTEERLNFLSQNISKIDALEGSDREQIIAQLIASGLVNQLVVQQRANQ